MQKLSPDSYASLELPDQWIEDEMQLVEAKWLVEQTAGYHKVLELGWGSGLVAQALHAAGRDVLVVEGAAESCNYARSLGIKAANFMFEDFAGGEYDCVVASFVLEHVAEPVALLKRIREWAPRLIVVVGNAASWHRRLAVGMGIQPALDTLSARDHAVGHYRVYTPMRIAVELRAAGWKVGDRKGLMFKPLPNSMMMHFDARLVRAMCEAYVPADEAGNMGIVCERV